MFQLIKNKDASRSSLHAEKVSIIATNMEIIGDLSSEGDIRVDGTVKGSIKCDSKVVITAGGKVEGNIQSVQADVYGTVIGHIETIESIALRTQSHIEGNINTKKLLIEANAFFNGQCSMTKEG